MHRRAEEGQSWRLRQSPYFQKAPLFTGAAEPPLESFTTGPFKISYEYGRPVLERRLQRLSRRQYRETHLEQRDAFMRLEAA